MKSVIQSGVNAYKTARGSTKWKWNWETKRLGVSVIL